MALNTFNPPVPPSPGTKNMPEIKLRKAPFGDGYSQSSPDGLNHIRRVVSLSWDVLTIEQATAIEDFFEAQSGCIPFLYALSDDTTRQWLCEKWDRSRDTPNKVTAEFREDFSLAL